MQEMTHRVTEGLKQLAFESHDSCSVCGHKFIEAETSHLGYDSTGQPQYTCTHCSACLVETAVRYYFMPRQYEVPELTSKLWRYMDFSKYVSLISSGSLFFARVDSFEDHFEGAKGLLSRKAKWDQHYLGQFRKIVRTPPEGYEFTKTDEEVEADATRLLLDLESGGKKRRESVFISCWHENERESAAMWRSYSSYIDNAIAVQTSYSSLLDSLGRRPDIQIGRVKYIDFQKSFVDTNNSFWYKRDSFEHEREVRAVLCDRSSTKNGIAVEADIARLVERVVISPTAPKWFSDVVNDVSAKFGLETIVQESAMNEIPFF